MSEERQVQGPPSYSAPTLTVHGKMVVLTAQGTKPGTENHGNVKGNRP